MRWITPIGMERVYWQQPDEEGSHYYYYDILNLCRRVNPQISNEQLLPDPNTHIIRGTVVDLESYVLACVTALFREAV
jgi:hypothetical protein